MTVSESISSRIREIMYEKNITIYGLEKISGLSKGTLTSLLYNRYNSVNFKTILIIIQSLEITVLEFFNNVNFENLDNIKLN